MKKIFMFLLAAMFILPYSLPPISVKAAGYVRYEDVFSPGEAVASIEGDGTVWSENARGELSAVVNIPQAGNYLAVIYYHAVNESVADIECQLAVNGQASNITLDQFYTYDVYPFAADERGDQIRPKLIKDQTPASMPAYAADGSSATPLLFNMPAGENEVLLSSLGGSVTIEKLDIVIANPIPSYESYLSGVSSGGAGTGVQYHEAEAIRGMSVRTIQLNSLAEAGLTPETYGQRTYNAIGGKSWQYPGQWLEWTVNIPEDGLYQFAFKYQQNINSGLNSYRRMEIDGVVPFAELLNIPFPYNTSWGNKVIGDDAPYLIYLTQGEHNIRLTSVNEPYHNIYESFIAIADEIRLLDIEVKGVTGTLNDQQVDSYRLYKLEDFIPDLHDRLMVINQALYAQLDILCDITGSTVDKFDVVRYQADKLQEYAEDHNLITKSFDALTKAQTDITTFAVTLNDQPIIMDSMAIVPEGEEIPNANPGFFSQLSFFVLQLISSFTDDHGNSSAISHDSVEVWVQRNRDYVNLLQQHANEYFTPQTGLNVNINYIPGQDILVLANSAGMQPHVVSGIGRDVPFNFALRNAISPLNHLEGYDDLAGSIPAGQLLPYHFVEQDYALPEEVIFNVMFYRSDIFEEYDMIVPDTWEDAQRLVPTLQQNQMNFWIAWGDWITFYYQFGMDPYTPDGLDVTLDNEQGFAIFKYWSELYTKYNFPQRIGSFYQNFRYGTIPAGISSLQDYFLMKMAAPELAGRWKIAPIPGIADEDGNVVRWQSGDQRGVMLFKTDAQREADGWEFIKWWLNEETQTNYALDLESAYGQEFRWFSANPEVVKKIPWDEADRGVILDQLKWFKGIPYSPGASYLLEREMKNALSAVVIDKKNYRDELEKAIRTTRMEMDKTQLEFEFIDENGNVLRTADMLEVPLPSVD